MIRYDTHKKIKTRLKKQGLDTEYLPKSYTYYSLSPS